MPRAEQSGYRLSVSWLYICDARSSRIPRHVRPYCDLRTHSFPYCRRPSDTRGRVSRCGSGVVGLGGRRRHNRGDPVEQGVRARLNPSSSYPGDET